MPPPPLAARIRRTVRRYQLFPPGARILAAVSGGSDSIALLHLLLELQGEGDLVVAGIAHFNHRLRGAASDEDEAFCRQLGDALALRMVVESADVAAVAREDRTSIEQAGRRVRYEFFGRAAVLLGADCVAVGHTRDDQAETFLLRLVRGAGPVGLAAIHPRAGIVVRPVLDVTRHELRDYLAERGIPFREDASNLDVSLPRNRVRHELLPLLHDRFSPAIVDTLSREAEIAREDAEYFEKVVTGAKDRVVSRTAQGCVIDLEQLRGYPAAVARRILKRAMEEVAPTRFVGFEAVDAVLELTDKTVDTTEQVDLPGQRAERRGETLVLRYKAGRLLSPGESQPAGFSYLLTVPGEVMLPEAACQISAEVGTSAAEQSWLSGRPDFAVVAAAELAGPLTVRSRHAGDTFRPLGLGGRKKLQDFFVDRKVQRAARDRVPLVVDGRNRIVWVAGYAIGEEFRVTDPAKAVVILRLKHLGGQG